MALAHENSELWDLADNIDSSVSESQKAELKWFETLNVFGRIVNETAEPTGSCVEGTKVNTPNDNGDVDALLISGKVSLEEGLFDYLPDYPAFLRIRYEGEHTKYFTESDVTDNGYILADILRNMTEKHFVINRLFTELDKMPREWGKGVTYSHASAVGVEKRTIKLSKNLMRSSSIVEKEIEKFDKPEAFRFLLEKASYLLTQTSDKDYSMLGDFLKTNMQWIKTYSENVYNVKKCQENEIINGAVLVKSADFVPAYKVKLGKWPRVAQDWIYRPRSWPSDDVVKGILEAGCHVVAKPLPHLVQDGKFIGSSPDIYFRLSFSVSEVLLAKSMNCTQLMCWKILKAYQKGFLETSPRVLTSYHWKNVMFWLCETEAEGFWVEENLGVAVKKAIKIMQRWISNSFIPQYFCRNMNLFGDCSPKTREMLDEYLGVIYADPVAALHHFFNNPPEARVCSLDTTEIPAGCRNKLIETGHATCCSMFNDLSEDKDIEKYMDCLKDAGNHMVDLYSEVSLNNAKSNERKQIIKNRADVTRKFFDGFATPLNNFKNEQEFVSHLKKEAWDLGAGLLKPFFSKKPPEGDLDLD